MIKFFTKKKFIISLLILLLILFFAKNYFNQKSNYELNFKIYKKKISQIFGLNIYENNIYASSTFHNRIVKLDLEGNYLSFMNFFGNFEELFENSDDQIIFENNNNIVGKMTNVHSVDFDNKGNMYISQYVPNEGGNNRGFTFVPKNCQGNCNEDDIKTFGGFKGVSHSYLDIDKKNLLVADYGGGEELRGDIFIFNLDNLNSGKKVSEISNHKFKKPHMIRHNNKNYYVVDTGNNEVIILDKNYNVINKVNNDFLERINNLEEIFKTIVGITFSDKLIFVSDVGTHSIFAFDYNWNLKFKIVENNYTRYNYNKSLTKIKSYSTSQIDLRLHSPFDLIYNDNRLYIANTHNDEFIILKFNDY